MPTQPQFAYRDQRLKISGDLTFATVMPIWRASLPLLKEQTQLHLDFSEVSAVDSAGLALILSWLRLAQRQKKQLTLQSLPSALLAIAKVSGVGELLGKFS